MMASAIIAAVATAGVLTTAATFYAVYSGPRKLRLGALVLVSAALVGASPFLALALGTSGQSWLRGLMIMGLIAFTMGLLLYAVTAVLSKQWASLVSAIPMTALAAWSFFFLAIFITGVA
jgi:hypothetical protein